MSGSGAADPDIKIEIDESAEGIWEPIQTGMGDGEPGNLPRAADEPAVDSNAVRTPYPAWLLEEWGRSERAFSDSPVPVIEARLFWDTEGNGRGGTLPLGRTSVAMDIPQLAPVRMPRPGGEIFPPFPTQTQSTEVYTPTYTNQPPPGYQDTRIQSEDAFQPTLVNWGQESVPSATVATEPDTPRGEAEPIGHRWTFRASRPAGSALSGNSRIPVSTTSPELPRRPDAQPMVRPSGSGARLELPALSRIGAGRQLRARLTTAVPSAPSTQTGLLVTKPAVPVSGRSGLNLPREIITRPRRGRVLPLNAPRQLRSAKRPGRPARELTEVMSTGYRRLPPPKLQPIYEGAAGCGVEGGLPVGPSEVGYVADTRFGSSAGTERGAASNVPSSIYWGGQAVPPSQLDFPTMDIPTMDCGSLAASMEEMAGLGMKSGRKRKAVGLQSARSPCVTAVTQWECGHSSVTGLVHSVLCRHGGEVGEVAGLALSRAVCPEPTTRMVLSSLSCTSCNPQSKDGRSEYVGGWLSEQAESKRRRQE